MMRRFEDLDISPEKLREAARIIWDLREAACRAMIAYRGEHPRGKCSAAEEQRVAYLGGIAAGLASATRQIEMCAIKDANAYAI